jgi:hypothetical protein
MAVLGVVVAGGSTLLLASTAGAVGAGQFCSPANGGDVAQGVNGTIACVDQGANGAFRWMYLRG